MSIRLPLCLLLTLLWADITAADVFKTVDKDGKVIYTDKPSGNQPAERVNLPPINTLPPEYPNNDPAQMNSTEAEAAEINYSVRIISPRENVTIPPGQRDLGIAVTLDQPLENGHWLVYFLNNELIEETQSTSIIVQDVARGSHTLVVEVIDSNGISLGKSDPVVVNVIRPVVKPAPTPKPKPKPKS